MPSLTPIATSPVTTIATGGPDKGKSVEDARAMKGRPADSVLDPATLEQRSKGRVRKAMSRKNNPIRGKWVEVTTRARKDAEKHFQRNMTAKQLWKDPATRSYAVRRCEMSLANTEAWSRENIDLFFCSTWTHSEYIRRSKVESLRTVGVASSQRSVPEVTKSEIESAPPAMKKETATASEATEPKTGGAKAAGSPAAAKPTAKAPAKPRTGTPIALATPVAHKAPVARRSSKAVGSRLTKKSSSPQQDSLPDLLAEDADAGPRWPKKQTKKVAAWQPATSRGHPSGLTTMVTRAVARAAEREELEASMGKHDVHALYDNGRKDSASAVVDVLLDAARTLEAAEALLVLAG